METETQTKPEWWHIYHDGLPPAGSHEQRQRQLLMAPMSAFIALASGSEDGTINALAKLLDDLRSGVPVRCCDCKRDLYPPDDKLPQPLYMVQKLSFASQIHFRHGSACNLARMCRKVLTGTVGDDPLKPH